MAVDKLKQFSHEKENDTDGSLRTHTTPSPVLQLVDTVNLHLVPKFFTNQASRVKTPHHLARFHLVIGERLSQHGLPGFLGLATECLPKISLAFLSGE